MLLDWFWQLEVPRKDLKKTLLKLVEGPDKYAYPTIANWSCEFSDYESENLRISFEEFFMYLEQSVYDTRFELIESKRGRELHFYDGNEATYLVHISYLDLKTSARKYVKLNFCGYFQPYWRTNLRLATFLMRDIGHDSQKNLLFKDTISTTLFILETLNVTYGVSRTWGVQKRFFCVTDAGGTGEFSLTAKHLGLYDHPNPILIVGNELVEHFELERLRNANSFAKWELNHSLFLFSDASNFYGIPLRNKYPRISIETEDLHGGELWSGQTSFVDVPRNYPFNEGQMKLAKSLDLQNFKIDLTLEE